MNPNPRIGVLLRQYRASAALFALLQPFGRWGLKRFQRDWPESRLRADLPGYTDALHTEWQALLAGRARSRPHLIKNRRRPQRQITCTL